MPRVTAVVLFSLVAHAHANLVVSNRTSNAHADVANFVDKLLDRAFTALPLEDADLDNSTLGKSTKAELPNGDQPINLLAMPPKSGSQSSRPAISNVLKESAKNAAGMLALAAMALMPMDADAARSGGRMGGGGFSRGPSMTRTMPRAPAVQSFAPRSQTNVYVSPGMGFATPGFGGFGGGFGGYGYSPFGGGMSTGTYLGFSLLEALIREQQRQAYLQQQLRVQQQLGTDQAMIAKLQAEVQAQDVKVNDMKAKAPPVDDATYKKLQEQLLAQQQEIEKLKSEKKEAAPPAFSLPR